jgi:tRNA modification GTPase
MTERSLHSSERILIRNEDTIAAISTSFGESGVGIVRISGPLAESIAAELFKPKKENPSFVSHKLQYGEIVDPETGTSIDEALIVLMRSPRTYTREDIVEIQCHGGYFVLQRILGLVLKQGARMAQPGEFTKRAFLNGRIDLTRAEAVIDVIKAKTQTSLDIANQQLKGWLYREMTTLKSQLIEYLALIEAHIDFPEEDIESISLEAIRIDLNRMVQKLQTWVESYEEGKIFREGITCAIIGKTNVGKSSLLNVLLKEERAIVTPIPGTTRDVIEEVLNIQGIPVRLVDTAGLRHTSDIIEREGVRRARERIAVADLVLVIFDRSRPIDSDDVEIVEEIKDKKKVLILNKIDLPEKILLDEIRKRFKGEPIVSISAMQGEGIDELKECIYTSLITRDVRLSPDHVIVANVRHKTAIVKIRDSLKSSSKGLEDGVSLEFTAFDIRSALEALGELVGETTPEDVLNVIFEQFCIGK